jgi:cysteinyl-tRNA synthetase
MLKVYNTLSRKKEVFRPRKGKKVNFFVCGPTVYDFSHIGHARTYIVFDAITKYLREKGYNVFYLQNITDIDDKIIKRAKEKKVSSQKLAKNFEKEYLKDMKSLTIDSVTKYARATGHIKEIILQVKRLLKKGYAYQIKDGIYFNIKKFKNYGKLSRRTVLQAEDAVSRIDESKAKRNRGDFCLWKRSKPKEPAWKSPWGLGRPGWHIEDTAITEKYFGSQYDIHGGAKDLIFPHHEAEIAQMEAISGKKPMVKYWLHSGFLTVKGRKMAKSLGNYITIRDFLRRNPPRLLRFLVIKNHYRSPIDYNEKLLSQAKKDSDRVAEFVGKLKDIISSGKQNSKTINALILKTRNKFEAAMDDDFNTPKAIAVIFDLVNKGNSFIAQNKMGSKNANDILSLFKQFDKILGINLLRAHYVLRLVEKLTLKDKTVLKLVKERESYRKKGQWKLADEIRKKVKKMGYWIEDTKKGPKIKKL